MIIKREFLISELDTGLIRKLGIVWFDGKVIDWGLK
jgi:hypothetical protein